VSAFAAQVVLVRHGETEWSRSGRHTGRTDIPLTEEGRRQARLAGESLRKRRFALVLTSPLQRAAETSRLAGFDGAARDELREWDYGEYEGRRTIDIRNERPSWSLWRDGVPAGETVEQVGRRADRVINEIRAVEGDVALFAHGHILRVLTARWLGLDAREGRLFALDTATISILGYEQETSVVRLWNERCTLRAAEDPGVALP
jgi:broad specificity phosphatase PhoE